MTRVLPVLAVAVWLGALGTLTVVLLDVFAPPDDLWLAPPRDGFRVGPATERRLWRWATRSQGLGSAPRDEKQMRDALGALEPGARPTARERRLIAAIRRARTAVVALAGGSGVNLRSWGLALTAWHVVRPVKALPVPVTFAGGARAIGWVVAGSARDDLALVRLGSGGPYPVASLAEAEPALGAAVVAVGTPAPGTGARPFHVSLGHVLWYGPRRGLRGDISYDAWTAYGHSGCPLFDESGRVVAIHNTLEERTNRRYGLRLRSVRAFLTRAADALRRRLGRRFPD